MALIRHGSFQRMFHAALYDWEHGVNPDLAVARSLRNNKYAAFASCADMAAWIHANPGSYTPILALTYPEIRVIILDNQRSLFTETHDATD